MVISIEPVTPTIRHKDVAASLYDLDGKYTSKDLYARYVSVCRDNNQPPATRGSYSKAIAEFGFQPWRTGATRGWHIHTNWIYATS